MDGQRIEILPRSSRKNLLLINALAAAFDPRRNRVFRGTFIVDNARKIPQMFPVAGVACSINDRSFEREADKRRG